MSWMIEVVGDPLSIARFMTFMMCVYVSRMMSLGTPAAREMKRMYISESLQS